MSETCDVNVFLYAANEASDQHVAAREFLTQWIAGPGLRVLFWPVLLGYLRIVTNPAVLSNPLAPDRARANIDALLGRPNVRAVGEAEGFWSVFATVATAVPARGNLVSDAHLVALMHQHGVGTIWTRDRDFRKFDGIRVRDPFTHPAR